MALLYIVLAIGVVVLNFERVPAVFHDIVYGAFNPAAVTGGVIGSFFLSLKKGVSRGIFSNEAGLGTGSIAHACADTSKPVKQGMFGIFEVFADTIVICTLTALVILVQRCSGQLRSCRRCRADNLRIHFYLRKLDICFYRSCHVLFCFLHDHRLGTLRCTLY